jgi:hypothetical protein
LPGVALNFDPLHLCPMNNWDYRCELPHLAPLFTGLTVFFKAQKF